MDDWLEFLGWWISEGWAEGANSIGICQSVNSPDTPKIEALLERLPFAFFTDVVNDNVVRWRCADKALRVWLEKNCGSGAGQKRLPEMAFHLNARQSRILLDALWDGDGHWEYDSPHYRGAYTTTSKELADGIQALIINIGEWGAVSINRKAGAHPQFPDAPTCWIVHRNAQKKRSLIRKRSIETVSYKGKVWCFEAPPNKMFITRRDGCPLIAGNTAMEKPLEMQFTLYRNQLGAMLRKMVRIVLQFQETYGGANYDSYNVDVSTDRLVENDLALISNAVSNVYRDVLNPSTNIPPETRQKIDVFMIQKVLEAMGNQDVQDIISIEDYGEPVVAELTESHVGEKVSAICPLCSFPESVAYPDHAGLLVCEGCGKTWDPSIEGRIA